jgi:hypothetical protein
LSLFLPIVVYECSPSGARRQRTHGPPAASTTSATSGIAAKAKQIVVKEIRAKRDKFPELVTQLVAEYSLVRLSAMSTA